MEQSDHFPANTMKKKLLGFITAAAAIRHFFIRHRNLILVLVGQATGHPSTNHLWKP